MVESLSLIDEYGLPIVGIVGLAIALWKTVSFVQKQLLNQIEERHNAEMEAIRQLEEEHKVFHGIVVTLIDNSKLNQMSLKEIKGNPDATITMYRAAPTEELMEGDLITPSKTDAQMYVDDSKVTSPLTVVF